MSSCGDLGTNSAYESSVMTRETIKSRFAAILFGIFSTLAPFSNARAGLPQLECEALLRTGWFRFDRHMAMPAGPNKGQPLAYSTPSPALRILTGEDLHIFPEPITDEYWGVSNFISKSGVSIAMIPKVAPRRVSLIREDETDGTWHLMLRLQFPKSHPIKYWTQNFDGLIHEPGELTDVLIDFGAHRLKDEEKVPYTAFRGLRGRYALQARMGSTAFKIRMVQKDKREIVEYAMSMSAGQKKELLTGFLERTAEINQGEMYHTVTNNCVTSFGILLETVGFSECHRMSRTNRILHGVVQWIPGGLLWSLRKKGVTMSAIPHPISL